MKRKKNVRQPKHLVRLESFVLLSVVSLRLCSSMTSSLLTSRGSLIVENVWFLIEERRQRSRSRRVEARIPLSLFRYRLWRSTRLRPLSIEFFHSLSSCAQMKTDGGRCLPRESQTRPVFLRFPPHGLPFFETSNLPLHSLQSAS